MNYCCENGFVKLVHVDICPKRASEAISELVILKKKIFFSVLVRAGGGGQSFLVAMCFNMHVVVPLISSAFYKVVLDIFCFTSQRQSCQQGGNVAL